MTSRISPSPSIVRNPKPPRRPGAWEMPIVTSIAAVILTYAWSRRNEGDLSPETGTGYIFGIVGSLLMLALLVYPLRKRIKGLRLLGNIRSWFRVHMLLGVVGPIFIILHSNFSLGSLNSTAAMISMLTVAGSGFIGRFFYAGIHRGLYGQKQTVRELLSDVAAIRSRTGLHQEAAAAIETTLTHYENSRVGQISGFWGSFVRTMTGPLSRARLKSRLMREVRLQSVKDGLSADAQQAELAAFHTALGRYFRALGRAEAFTLYERLFAAWHLLHLPLFAILVLAALGHVVAVHLY